MAASSRDRARRGRGTIVVVDDETDLRMGLSRVLEDEGYSVAQFANGRDALEYLQAWPLPAVLVTDLAMPVMDGETLIASIRKNPALEPLAIVVVSGNHRGSGVPRRVPVLSKPLDVERLLGILENVSAHRDVARNRLETPTRFERWPTTFRDRESQPPRSGVPAERDRYR